MAVMVNQPEFTNEELCVLSAFLLSVAPEDVKKVFKNPDESITKYNVSLFNSMMNKVRLFHVKLVNPESK